MMENVDGCGIVFDYLVSLADDDGTETLMIRICDPDPQAVKCFKLDVDGYNAGPELVVLLVPRWLLVQPGNH